MQGSSSTAECPDAANVEPPEPSFHDAEAPLPPDPHALVRRPPNAGAPAPNDLTSSADEAEDEDDAEDHHAGTRLVKVEPLELKDGGWAVLHGLRNDRPLNGLLVRVCGWQIPHWWDPAPAAIDEEDLRIFVEIVERPPAGRQVRLRVAARNLQAVRIEEGIGRLFNAWLDSGFETDWQCMPVFEVPVWEALRDVDEKMRANERAIVHGMCLDMAQKRGVAVTKINPDNRTTPSGHPDRQVRLKYAHLEGASSGVVSGSASASATELVDPSKKNDLRMMPFYECCHLLEALEGVDHGQKGFNARRRQLLESFWRRAKGDAAPRHLRANLFDLFRLLLPHNDPRRYFWGASGVAKAVGHAMGLNGVATKRLAENWREGSAGRDLASVLRDEWDARCRVERGTQRITIGDVNEALDKIDRAHADRGKDKRDTLAALVRGRCSGAEVKWIVRILMRNVAIGERPSMPVAHKGEWPKLVMDGLCRAQGRVGRPSIGNPPLMYTLFRHQHSLYHVCAQAEAGRLPAAYPPPTRLGVHIRAQGSVPLLDESAAGVHERLLFTKAETDRRVFVETKYDGFRLQIHYSRDHDDMRFFYRSGIDSTEDIAPDLEPAMRLSLGARPKQMIGPDGMPRERYTYLSPAWDRAQQARPAEWEPPQSIILDGELLVYDEGCSKPGLYDELGSTPGVVGFGTHFWITIGTRQDGEPAGGRYSREDCRRHYLVKVFDLLHLNGRDMVSEAVPLYERRALLEGALLTIPNYVEVIHSELVDLATTPDRVEKLFDASREAGAEGLMIKAACRSYVPNARTNVLKLKREHIAGLGDTVTLLVVGARYARRVGTGADSSLVCELAIAAPTAAATASAESEQGPFDELLWLFNTAALSYSEKSGGVGVVAHEQLLRRLNEEIITGNPVYEHKGVPSTQLAADRPLMRRYEADEPAPGWLQKMPTGKERRPHFILVDPEDAIKVEVLGSRFLTRFKGDEEAVDECPWKLRFPRVIKWHADPSADSSIPDTLSTFRRKGCDAWIAVRGQSWESIAQDVYDRRELGDDGAAPVIPMQAEAPPEELQESLHGQQALEGPRSQKRARLDGGDEHQVVGTVAAGELAPNEHGAAVGEGRVATTFDGSLLEATAYGYPLVQAGMHATKAHAYDVALTNYRQAAAYFLHIRQNDIEDRLTMEYFRRKDCLDQHVDATTALIAHGESAAASGQTALSAESAELVKGLMTAAAAYSGVAGTLEQRAPLPPHPAAVKLREAEIEEALRMRVRAKSLYDDAVEEGGITELKRDVLAARLKDLCKRDEVKDYLHGKLVNRMVELHKRMAPEDKKDLDLIPDERR